MISIIARQCNLCFERPCPAVELARTCLPCRGMMLRYPAGVVVVMLSSTTSVLWLYHGAGAPLKHSTVMRILLSTLHSSLLKHSADSADLILHSSFLKHSALSSSRNLVSQVSSLLETWNLVSQVSSLLERPGT